MNTPPAAHLYKRHRFALDEVFLTIHQERHYLWRAVHQDGAVLDILGWRRRYTVAAMA
jgi:putative transposase